MGAAPLRLLPAAPFGTATDAIHSHICAIATSDARFRVAAASALSGSKNDAGWNAPASARRTSPTLNTLIGVP